MWILVLALVAAPPVLAHDPSLWGGLYRSRDHGAIWLPAHGGRFITAALAVAIDPTDPNHLLLATDSGLLRSHNGGLDWEVEAPDLVRGAVFAVTFDADGLGSLASTAAGLYAARGSTWRPVTTPPGAVPARALLAGAATNRAYLAGWQGLFRSDDWGESWVSLGDGLPEGAVSDLAVGAGTGGESLWAVAAGQVWTGADGTRSWQQRANGLPSGAIQSFALARSIDGPVWAAGADRLFRSDDRGASWRTIGGPLPEANTAIRAIGPSVDGAVIVLTTDRGLFRSPDGGVTWELLTENLPVHLESRPLVRDPHDAASLYVGYSIVPYDELWRSAAEGRSALARLDPLNLASAAAFLILLVLAFLAALRRLARFYGPPAIAPAVGAEGGVPALERAAR